MIKILPYVYHLVNTKNGNFYFGFRCANKVKAKDDLGKVYFTSSKTINRGNFHNWKIASILEFDTKEEAYDYEQLKIKENFSNQKLVNRFYLEEGRGRFVNVKGKLNKKRELRLNGINNIDEIFYDFKFKCLSFTELKTKYILSQKDIIFLFDKNSFEYKDLITRNRKASISRSLLKKSELSDKESNKIANMIKNGLSLTKISKLTKVNHKKLSYIVSEFKLEQFVSENQKKWSGSAAKTTILNRGGTRLERAHEKCIEYKSRIKAMVKQGKTFKEIKCDLFSDIDFAIHKSDLKNILSEHDYSKLTRNWRGCRTNFI